eukprot:s1602_g5.t1
MAFACDDMTDVLTLKVLAARLESQRPRREDSVKRAAVALIFRIRGPVPYPISREGLLLGDYDACGASVELLYILRTSRTGDKWSGHVPGSEGWGRWFGVHIAVGYKAIATVGKQEEGDPDDRSTAVRETQEEIGLHLESKNFVFLGQLDDRVVTGGGVIGRVITGFYLAPTLWLQRSEATPPIDMQLSEVQAWRWVPWARLSPSSVQYDVELNITSRMDQWLPCMPSRLRARLADVKMPCLFLEAADAHATSSSDTFRLWGLTLGATSDALVLGGGQERNLAWPPMRFQASLANLILEAWCGAQALRRPRPRRQRGRQLLALVVLLTLAMLCGFLGAGLLRRLGGSLYGHLTPPTRVCGVSFDTANVRPGATAMRSLHVRATFRAPDRSGLAGFTGPPSIAGRSFILAEENGARDRQRQACKKERMTLLNLTASEVEVLFDKAEASCQKAKEDTEKLQELLEDGLLSSDMVEMCKQVKAVVESAEEELLIAKERAEELARGDASGILDDHRTESTRLLTRCGKPKSLIAAAKIALSQRERLVAVKRTAEVQELGKRARSALRAGSPKAQGTGTELLSGLGDPDGDPLDKDDVASFLRLQLESTTDDLVMAWLDFVTKGSDNNDIITREDIWTLIRICYKVVKSTVLTTDVSALDSTVLAKLEVNEVVELIGDEEPTMDEAADLHRVRVRRLRDGQEGWVTVRGNAGTVYLQLGGDRLSVAKETSLTESLSIGGQDALRQLRCGEILDIMGEETVDETTGLLRCRVRAQNDGKVGWATKVGNQGTIFLRQL